MRKLQSIKGGWLKQFAFWLTVLFIAITTLLLASVCMGITALTNIVRNLPNKYFKDRKAKRNDRTTEYKSCPADDCKLYK